MQASLVEQRNGYDAEAIAARMEEIIGKPQRVPPLKAEDVDGPALELITRIRASVGSATNAADIPGYFLTMVKHPDIFRCQLELGTVIFNGKLPKRERELAVLRIGWLLRAPYEWGEHVDLGKRYGLSAEEVARVIEGSGADGWSRRDAAILAAVEQMLSVQYVDDATWAVLADGWDDAQLIEFTMMVGQYVATGLLQNTLRIRLAADNPGLTYR